MHFGPAVAAIVEGCTDTFETPKPKWETRKRRYIEHLTATSPSVCLVAAGRQAAQRACHPVRLQDGRRRVVEAVLGRRYRKGALVLRGLCRDLGGPGSEAAMGGPARHGAGNPPASRRRGIQMNEIEPLLEDVPAGPDENGRGSALAQRALGAGRLPRKAGAAVAAPGSASSPSGRDCVCCTLPTWVGSGGRAMVADMWDYSVRAGRLRTAPDGVSSPLARSSFPSVSRINSASSAVMSSGRREWRWRLSSPYSPR